MNLTFDIEYDLSEVGASKEDFDKECGYTFDVIQPNGEALDATQLVLDRKKRTLALAKNFKIEKGEELLFNVNYFYNGGTEKQLIDFKFTVTKEDPVL